MCLEWKIDELCVWNEIMHYRLKCELMSHVVEMGKMDVMVKKINKRIICWKNYKCIK
jgi:hypothetical protein